MYKARPVTAVPPAPTAPPKREHPRARAATFKAVLPFLVFLGSGVLIVSS